MKINSGFIAHDDGEEKLLVSTGSTKFSGLVRSNSTAGFIINCLTSDTTEDEIVAKMLQKYEVSDEIARRDVRKIVEQLRNIGAIDD
ncbi:MAG: PqqD family protein [Oscillospiraceae bacterium]|nr:PqqD family protein [Oscillospiraceae bacterium]MBR7084229.1 PqqD family protein [Oscillospiraceae bacterium]